MPLFADSTDIRNMLLIVMAISAGFLMIRTRRYFAQVRNKVESDRTTLTLPDDPDAISPPPDELMQWQVELHDMSREASAQLDTKMAALRVLIDEADRAAARLEAAMGRSGEPAEQPNPIESLRPAASDEPKQPAARSGPREEIYTLADYGYDPAEIAHRVGRPIGEVELVLSLRDRT